MKNIWKMPTAYLKLMKILIWLTEIVINACLMKKLFLFKILAQSIWRSQKQGHNDPASLSRNQYGHLNCFLIVGCSEHQSWWNLGKNEENQKQLFSSSSSSRSCKGKQRCSFWLEIYPLAKNTHLQFSCNWNGPISLVSLNLQCVSHAGQVHC